MRRVLAAGAAALTLLAAVPATAAGTGGVEVSPPGEGATSFRIDVPSRGGIDVPFALRNVGGDGLPRSARVYVAAVTRSGDGFVLGDPGSSPWVEMSDQHVTLNPAERREESFRVTGGELPDGEVLAAVVVEVTEGAVVQRASTLVYLSSGRQIPLPVLLLSIATALVVLAGAGVVVAGRRRRA